MNIEYTAGGEELFPFLSPLWEKLRDHHADRSVYFAAYFRNRFFEDRICDLTNDGKILLKVDLARDQTDDKIVGYCISAVNKDQIGEIESLFIEEAYRGLGIGNELMERAIRWLDDCHVKSKKIAVAVGNEEVFGFYQQFGFYPRLVILEEMKE